MFGGCYNTPLDFSPINGAIIRIVLPFAAQHCLMLMEVLFGGDDNESSGGRLTGECWERDNIRLDKKLRNR